MEEMKKYADSLSESITMTKGEGLLLIAAAALSGYVLGKCAAQRRYARKEKKQKKQEGEQES